MRQRKHALRDAMKELHKSVLKIEQSFGIQRWYHVVFVYETHRGKRPKGSKEYMTVARCTHEQATTFKSKMVPSKIGRWQLEEQRDPDRLRKIPE